jgi:hypothetical protein
MVPLPSSALKGGQESSSGIDVAVEKARSDIAPARRSNLHEAAKRRQGRSVILHLDYTSLGRAGR